MYEDKHSQSKKCATSNDSDNQYKVYFYDPKESPSRNVSNLAESSVSSNLLRVQSQISSKSDVPGYIMIGKYISSLVA